MSNELYEWWITWVMSTLRNERLFNAESDSNDCMALSLLIDSSFSSRITHLTHLTHLTHYAYYSFYSLDWFDSSRIRLYVFLIMCILLVTNSSGVQGPRPWYMWDTARHGNTLHYTAPHCNTRQHTATHGNTLLYTAPHCTTLHHTATHCTTMQHTATHCNTLQHTATH